MLRALDRISSVAAAILGATAVVLLFCLLAINLTLVVTRDFMRISLVWVPEASAYLLLWLTYLAAPVAAWRGEHFVIDALSLRLKGRARALLVLAADIIGALFLLIWLIAGLRYQQLQRAQTAMLIPWLPMTVVDAALPLGVGGMLLMHVTLSLKRLRGAADHADGPES